MIKDIIKILELRQSKLEYTDDLVATIMNISKYDFTTTKARPPKQVNMKFVDSYAKALDCEVHTYIQLKYRRHPFKTIKSWFTIRSPKGANAVVTVC